MRLALDEHYAAEIAAQLDHRGHDVVAVAAVGLAGLDDEPLLAWCHGEGRALLTNVQDFAPLHGHWLAAGRPHHGLWFTDDRRLPRSRRTIGTFVTVLDEHMTAHPADDAFTDRILWLP